MASEPYPLQCIEELEHGSAGGSARTLYLSAKVIDISKERRAMRGMVGKDDRRESRW